jgi:CheY-like chemotaxis protein
MGMTETTTVLLVDDDAFNREGVRLFLRREHCEVLEAGDAQSALAMAAAGAIHVAVIDISIPPDPATPVRVQHISVALARSDQRVIFEIVDDGAGSLEADRAQAEARGSFGLKSMRDRIEALGGAFEFVSSPGQGSVVRGWVPGADG